MMRYFALILTIIFLFSNDVKASEQEALPWLSEAAAVKAIDDNLIESLSFKENFVILNNTEKSKLDNIVALLNGDKEKRIILKSFSTKAKSHLNEDRQESLKRAIWVRNHLIKKGIKSSRIIVKALGNVEGASKDVMNIIELTK